MWQQFFSASAPHADLMAAQLGHYERVFARYGACAAGMDWESERKAERRYEKLAEGVLRLGGGGVLDFGCGYGGLAGHLARDERVTYWGFDLSAEMIATARRLFPGVVFFCEPAKLDDPGMAPDITVANGVFTESAGYGRVMMKTYLRAFLASAVACSRKAVMFNVKSPLAPARRDDLFYLDLEDLKDIFDESWRPRFCLDHSYDPWEFFVILDLRS